MRSKPARVTGWATFPGTNKANTGIIFADDFSGSTLNPAWQVLPGKGSISVGGGSLRYFNDGPTASTTGWNNQALTLALNFAGTDWKIDTKATYHLDWLLSENYSGPPDPVQNGNSSGSQGPEVLVSFANTASGTNYAGTNFVRIERVIDAFYGSNGLFVDLWSAKTPPGAPITES